MNYKTNLQWKGLRRDGPDKPRPLADAVLRLIWQKHQMSRAEIARKANLSRSTVSEIINEILPLGVVAEIGEGPSKGGRRPIMLEFQDDSCVILGVEMSGTHIVIVMTNLRGHIIRSESADHPVRKDPQGTRELIARLCENCLNHKSRNGRPLLGIGIAVPTPINPADPNRISKVVLPDWCEKLELSFLEDQFNVPVMIDNDANLGAIAEQWWGLGRKKNNFAYIKVSTGIGSGHIINGEIYRGSNGTAGEIGHISIDPKGKKCICGLNGCLATIIGGNAILERVKELSIDFPDSSLVGKDNTISLVWDAAISGDPLALIIAEETATNLGVAVAGLINLMNPSLVVIAGELAHLGDHLLEPLRDSVRTRTLISSADSVEIVTSELGPNSVAIGASTMVLKTALNDSRRIPRVSA